MATAKELKRRWEIEPGKTILKRVQQIFQTMWPIHHGFRSEEILALLEGLPFREEVPGGKDLRGAGIGGVRELNLTGWDFSFGGAGACCYCNFTGAKFDHASVTQMSENIFREASFRKATIRWSGEIQDARNCNFEEARIENCSLGPADFSSSCFRHAKLKLGGLVGSDLRGCDFRGATLQDIVFREIQLDKTTDFRGATLINIQDEDYRDGYGKVWRGTDWRLANFDETTRYIHSDRYSALDDLNTASGIAESDTHPLATKMYALLQETAAKLKKKFDPEWYDHLAEGLNQEEWAYLEEIFKQAAT